MLYSENSLILTPLLLGVEMFTTGTPFGATSNLVLCAEFGSTTKLAANISIMVSHKLHQYLNISYYILNLIMLL